MFNLVRPSFIDGAVAASPQARLSLREELPARGIPTLPKRAAREHRAALLREARPGALCFIAPTLLTMLGVLRMLSFMTLAEMPTWRRGRSLTVKEQKNWVLLLAMCSLAGWWEPFFLVLLTSFVAAYLLLKVLHIPALARATSHWDWQFASAANWRSEIPGRLRERAELATQVSGAKVVVEFLMDDPFLAVRRGFGPFAEKEYIGAWDTGRDDLDRV